MSQEVAALIVVFLSLSGIWLWIRYVMECIDSYLDPKFVNWKTKYEENYSQFYDFKESTNREIKRHINSFNMLLKDRDELKEKLGAIEKFKRIDNKLCRNNKCPSFEEIQNLKSVIKVLEEKLCSKDS